MHFLLEAFITPFTIVLLLKNIFPLGGNNNLGTIIVIAAMILIAGVGSFVQNIRTSDTVDNLLKMVSITTNIKRDGEDQELPTDQVVVGDIINLSAGDMVPADMRLLRSKDLFCTTSSINGDYNPKEIGRASLAKLKQDGINVKILTGDNEAVTRALGLRVGLKVDTIYSAEDFENKSDDEIAKMVEESNIFVQMTPDVKIKIIKALKQNGHVVSYMGDKNNDALAMREADVGIAFDNAVDIAKETASIILMHHDLSVLEMGD